ncbi:5-oxoprolinase subunit PxpB [Pseudomonas monteilii]|uniref:5-oxoprolinase subunit PxpB n=1 Tax=Pseudomonas alabamensis TaxID=3064349 RepID=UPI0027124445|nr:5-oxoprolinase subunit PxpB [Pseudomonas sp. 22-AL-CL-001]MDO7910918.1 5-oxoprolinase subunit PxpB [Pseudomonas sp. 22-AL-CL-001]
MTPRLEVVAVDTFMVRLFERIDPDNMPWLLAATRCVSTALAGHVIDLVPSYTTLMIQADLPPIEARRLIEQALRDVRPSDQGEGQRHEIPVWYDPQVGPELDLIARRAGLSREAVIALHSGTDYPVFALGFAPGFGFMGLVDERLASPRLPTPRQRVAAGSVGIAERQTAAYPAVSPGGWNLIGRTPVTLFDRHREGYSLLQPGDRVRFVAIDQARFLALGGDDTPLETRP